MRGKVEDIHRYGKYGGTLQSNLGDPMKPTILAVDDNEIQAYTLVKTLEHAGYHVLQAGTGSKALSLSLEHKPDAILLDINLPDVNGFEVCARLKANAETSHIPVIFHTATHATALAKNHAELVGAAAFLTYPIYVDHLLVVLRGTLAKESDDGKTKTA